MYGRENNRFQEGGISMKNFSEFKTEIEQVIQNVDEKTKDWSDENWERDWKKTERDTMMEYFKDLSEGNTDPYIDPYIYKGVFKEGIQRRKRSQTEYLSKINSLSRQLKNKEGDDKIDILGELVLVGIQFQLFGMR